MAKKPIPPNLNSILNSPENINMNESVRAQIEAAQAQIDKGAKEATRQLKKAEKEAKEATKQLKKAAKEAKQTEKETKEATRQLKKTEKEAKEATRQLKKAEKEAKQTEKEEKKSFKDKILDFGSTEFNKVFPLLGKIMSSKNTNNTTDLNTNINTASTDSSYYILTDIVSSQQTTINILKQILKVLKDDNNNDNDDNINIPELGGRGSSRTRGRTRSKAGDILKILGLAFASVGAGALGAAAYDNYFNNSSANLQQAPMTPPITPIPDSQIYDRDETVSVPIIRMNAADAASNIPRAITLNPVPTPDGIRLNAGVDTTAIRLNQSTQTSSAASSINKGGNIQATSIPQIPLRISPLDSIGTAIGTQSAGRNNKGFTNLPSNSQLQINVNPTTLPERQEVNPQRVRVNSDLSIPDKRLYAGINNLSSPINQSLSATNELPNIKSIGDLSTTIMPRIPLRSINSNDQLNTKGLNSSSTQRVPFQMNYSNIPNLLHNQYPSISIDRSTTNSTRQPSIPVVSAAPIRAAQPASAASVTQPEDAARQPRLEAVQAIGRQADAFKAGVNRITTPLRNTFGNMQEKRKKIEEDGVKQYKADEIVFKADKFDFGNKQESSMSASPASPTSPSTGGTGTGTGGGGTNGTTAAASPVQTAIGTGSNLARNSAANAAAEKIMPAAPQPPAATGQNTRASGGQQRSDVIPQIDPKNPGPLEPADAGSRYARLFGMGVAA